MTAHRFVDLVRGDECKLHVEPAAPMHEGGLSVEHPGCLFLAGVTVELDAWYCGSARPSGACGERARSAGRGANAGVHR